MLHQRDLYCLPHVYKFCYIGLSSPIPFDSDSQPQSHNLCFLSLSFPRSCLNRIIFLPSLYYLSSLALPILFSFPLSITSASLLHTWVTFYLPRSNALHSLPYLYVIYFLVLPSSIPCFTCKILSFLRSVISHSLPHPNNALPSSFRHFSFPASSV